MAFSFSDDLISAYLDGELSAQEQAMVEAALRDNAELRRLCDELRTLRAALQAIPDEPPPAGLTERVLRQAERRMLLGPESTQDTDDPGQQSAAAARPAPQDQAAPARLARPVWWREHGRWVATCAASAAVLLLAVLILSNRSPQYVASQADSGAPAAESDELADDSEAFATAAEGGESIESAPLAPAMAEQLEQAVEKKEAAASDLAPGSNVERLPASRSLGDAQSGEERQGVSSGQIARGMLASPAAAPEPTSPPADQGTAGASENFGRAGGFGGGGAAMGRDKGFGAPTLQGAEMSRGGMPGASAPDSGAMGLNTWAAQQKTAAQGEQAMQEFEQHHQLLVLVRLPRRLAAQAPPSSAAPAPAAGPPADEPAVQDDLQVASDGLVAARLQAAFGSRPDLQIRPDRAGGYVVEGQLEAVRASLEGLLGRRIDELQLLAVSPPSTADRSDPSFSFEPPQDGAMSNALRRATSPLDDAQRPRHKLSPDPDAANRESTSREEGARTPREELDRVAAEEPGARGEQQEELAEGEAPGKEANQRSAGMSGAADAHSGLAQQPARDPKDLTNKPAAAAAPKAGGRSSDENAGGQLAKNEETKNEEAKKDLASPPETPNTELVVRLLFRVGTGQPIMPAEAAQQPESAVSGKQASPGNSAPPADPPPLGRGNNK